MLIWVGPSNGIAAGEPPPWVATWVESRTKKAEAKQQKAEKAAEGIDASPADLAARAKREAARLRKVGAGLDDLDLWLGDLIRSGLTTLGTRSPNLWDEQARRLVDAQCPGVARRLRQIDAMSQAGEGWQAALLDRLAQLHLLVEGFRHRDALPEAVWEDIKTAIGFPTDLDAIRSGAIGTSLRDTWQVLGQAFSLDEKVTTRRTWLVGRDTRRVALVLDFSAANRPFEVQFEPATAVAATLGFFPGAAPVRALLIERHAPAEPLVALTGGVSIAEAQAAFGTLLSRSPWVELAPVILSDVTLKPGDDGWSAVDPAGALMPLTRTFDRGWHIAALAGGGPFTLAGEFDGAVLNPLGAVVAGLFVPLGGADQAANSAPACGAPGRWLTPASTLLLEATAAAVIGVERKPPPVVGLGDPLATTAAGIESQPPPLRLLGLVAAAGLYARVGRRPASGAPPVDRPAPATEDRVECSPVSAGHLRRLLAGEFGATPSYAPDLFHRWFAACAEAKQRLPHHLIAPTLAAFQATASVTEILTRIIGTRGRWLAEQNPKWAQYTGLRSPTEAESVWETGTKAERLALLRILRTTDPDEARRLVASSFAREPAALRSEIVQCLDRNLAIDDEPFLEAALDDRSKEVRGAAADLLARLPGSRFAARMTQRARSILRWDGDRLAIQTNLPIDEAMIRDGITREPRPQGIPGQATVGVKAWLLHEVLSRTPGAAIAEHLGQPAAAIIAAGGQTEYAQVMTLAWEAAAIRSRDSIWSLALLQSRLDADGRNRVVDQDQPRVAANDRTEFVHLDRLFTVLGPADRATVIQALIAAKPDLFSSDNRALWLLNRSDGVLDPTLGREILQRSADRLAREARRVRGADPKAGVTINWALISFLEGFDSKLPLELCEEAERLLGPELEHPFDEPHHHHLTNRVAAMLNRWKFRRDMHQEFARR